MKKILLFILLLPFLAKAQTVGHFRYDTSRFYINGGTTNVKVEGRLIAQENQLKSGGYYTTSFTIPSRRTASIYLGTISTDRNVTFPTLTALDTSVTILLANLNTSAYHWNVVGTVEEADGDAITVIPTSVSLYTWVGNRWVKSTSGETSPTPYDTIFVAAHNDSLFTVLYTYEGIRDSSYCCMLGGGGGGATIYTADGIISENRTVTTADGFQTTFAKTAFDGVPSLGVSNTGDGPAISATSTNGSIYGISTDSVGIEGVTLNGNAAGHFIKINASDNTLKNALRVRAKTNSTAVTTGLAAGMDFWIGQTGSLSGIEEFQVAQLWGHMTDLTPGSQSTKFHISGWKNNAYVDFLSINQDYGIVNNGADTLATRAYARSFGGGGVTSVGTGYGLSGGTITSTGTITADTTNQLASKLRLYKVADSLAVLISAGGLTNVLTTTGDMIYSSSGTIPARRAIGTSGQVLTVSSGVPAWATPVSVSGFSTPLVTVASKNQSRIYAYSNTARLMGTVDSFYTGSVYSAATGTFLGINSGLNTSGRYGVYVGYASAQNNTGSSVVAIGHSAALNNTGSNLVGVGLDAIRSNTGSNVVGIGVSSLQNNTATEATATGYFSLSDNTGNYSSGLGAYAARNNTGTYAVALGHSPLFNNIGDYNIAIGGSALYHSNSSQRIAIGFQAGYQVQNGIVNDFASAAVTGTTINIPAHGLGSSGVVNLKYTLLTGSSMGGMSSGAFYRFTIVDANNVSLSTISSAGSGTFRLTKDVDKTNVVEIGYQANATKANQSVIGNTSSKEFYGYGAHKIDSFENRRVIVDGDSYSASGGYTDILNDSLPYFAKAGRRNYAVPGSLSGDVVARFNTTVSSDSVTAAGQERYYLLYIGLNDITAGGITADSIYKNLKYLWGRARAAGMRVVAYTIIRTSPTTAGAKETVRTDLNAMIQSDPSLYDWLVDLDKVINYYSDNSVFTDGTHVNAAGQRLIIGAIKRTLQAVPFQLSSISGVTQPAMAFDMTLNPTGAVTINKLNAGSSIVGTATLVGGTVTVNTTKVTASSKIYLTVNTPAGTQGFLSAPTGSIVAGTSFVINSSSGAETSTVNWLIIN